MNAGHEVPTPSLWHWHADICWSEYPESSKLCSCKIIQCCYIQGLLIPKGIKSRCWNLNLKALILWLSETEPFIDPWQTLSTFAQPTLWATIPTMGGRTSKQLDYFDEVHHGYRVPTAPHFSGSPARLLIAALKRSVEHAASVHLERTALLSWVNPHRSSKMFILRAKSPFLAVPLIWTHHDSYGYGDNC